MLKYVLLSLFVIAFLNVMAFMIVASSIGGDALSGGHIGGHYFVSNHGKVTEVSEAVYTYSLWHIRSLFVTMPVGMGAGAGAVSRFNMISTMFKSDAAGKGSP